MVIETCNGSKSDFRVERVTSGAYCVRRLDGAVAPDDIVAFRNREVALAYARASAALDRYLAALDTTSDASAEFEEWRQLDEVFELRSMAAMDAPQAGAVPTLH